MRNVIDVMDINVCGSEGIYSNVSLTVVAISCATLVSAPNRNATTLERVPNRNATTLGRNTTK